MSLLLAVGRSSVSSGPLWRPRGADGSRDAGAGAAARAPAPARCEAAVAVALSPDRRLRVVVALRGPAAPGDGTTEVRVHVAPAADPVTGEAEVDPSTPACRVRREETAARGSRSAGGTPSHVPDSLTGRIRPSAVFSSDKRHLSCLVPAGDGIGGSTVALFELSPAATPPRAARARPPRPAYLSAPVPGAPAPGAPVVAAYRGTVLPPTTTLLRRPEVSCLEDVATACRRTEPGPSVLLVGTRHGEILAASYETGAIAGTLHEPSPREGGDLCHDMRQIRHCTEWSARTDDGTSIGKAVALYADGSAVVFLSHLRIARAAGHGVPEDDRTPAGSSDGTGLRIPLGPPSASSAVDCVMKMEPIYRILGQSFVCSEWLCGSYLALMRHQGPHCMVEAYAISKDGAVPVTSWKTTAERVLEARHASFHVDDDKSDEKGTLDRLERTGTLQYDPSSDCLAISGAVATKLDTSRNQVSFACVWNWRSNVEGFLIANNVPTHGQLLVSTLCIGFDSAGATKLVHCSCSNSSETARVRVNVYESALLSPRSSYPSSNGSLGLQTRSNLLLSRHSVSYPTVTKASAVTEYEIEWRESAVPAEYVESYGPLCLAAIGQKSGRSIAVASSHGFCTMDCSRASLDTNTSGGLPYYKAMRHRRAHKRWRRFEKNTEEESFSVLSMGWWEDEASGGEDFLVALIEVRTRDEAGRYLSCWSPKMLDLDHQLMFPTSSLRKSRWGIPLSKNVYASSLHILKDPTNSQKGKAIILLSDESAATSFCIYQLQVISEQLVSHDPYRDSLPYVVLVHCAFSDGLGSSADLFLASGYFGFELQRLASTEPPEPAYIAVLAVRWFPAKGINALCVKPSGIIAVGPILESKPHSVHVELSGIWHADDLCRRRLGRSLSSVNMLCWLLEFSDGSLLSWFVPYSTNHDISEELLKPIRENERGLSLQFIHSECSVLGYRIAAGKVSFWMQQSSRSQRKCLMMNTCPDSAYGCILGSGQAVQKFHRSLGEHFEYELFRPDFLEHETLGPSDLVLSVPAFIPVFYAQLVFAAKIWKAQPDEISCIFSHAKGRIKPSMYRDVALKAMQLLMMGLIEEIGSLVERSKSHRIASFVFAALVEYSRLYSTPLQFAAVHIEIGRQLEPCFFDHLFPLPMTMLKESKGISALSILDSTTKTARTVLDLFNLSLVQGSISTAASSLPLLDDPETLKSNCDLILHHCLERIDADFEAYQNVGFNIVSEEQLVISDIFRYVMKLENASAELCEDYDSSDDEYATSSENGRSVSNGAFFLFCGMLGRMRLRQPVMSGGDDISVDGTNWSDEIRPGDCAHMVAKYLLRSVNKQDHWTKAAALATVILGGSMSGLQRCSEPRIAQLLAGVGPSNVLSFLPIGYRVNGGLVKYFVKGIQACEQQIGKIQAASLLDLILVLLGRDEGLSLEIPGLLFMAMIAAHFCDGDREIVRSDHDKGCPLLDAFHEALSVVKPI